MTSSEISEAVTTCSSCGSEDQTQFNSEIMIHFSGLKHLSNPGVLVFPRLLVCLDCGVSQFTLPERELNHLKETIAAKAVRRGSVVRAC